MRRRGPAQLLVAPREQSGPDEGELLEVVAEDHPVARRAVVSRLQPAILLLREKQHAQQLAERLSVRRLAQVLLRGAHRLEHDGPLRRDHVLVAGALEGAGEAEAQAARLFGQGLREQQVVLPQQPVPRDGVLRHLRLGWDPLLQHDQLHALGLQVLVELVDGLQRLLHGRCGSRAPTLTLRDDLVPAHQLPPFRLLRGCARGDLALHPEAAGGGDRRRRRHALLPAAGGTLPAASG
mmetsp:Transcript_17456/g.49009  ORF Transcript_17456/g.49009 Transcript_17456/m.49009 type:complete len:237 (+) Transcript_17456:363-1073(+)